MIALILHSFILTLLLVAFKHYLRRAPLASVFLPGAALKIVAGIGYGYIYVGYYGGVGDSLNYFFDAAHFVHLAREDPIAYLKFLLWNEYSPMPPLRLGNIWGQSRALFAVKIVSVLNLISGNNYWISGFYFSLFSYGGLWCLANRISVLFPKTRLTAILAGVLFPSIVFFSSGLTKESLAMGFLGFCLARLLGYFPHSKKRSFYFHLGSLGIIGISMYALSMFKLYYLAALLFSMLCLFTSYSIFRNRPKASFWFIGLSNVGLALVLGIGCIFISEYFGLLKLPGMIVRNHNTTYIFSAQDDLVHYSTAMGRGYITLQASWPSLIYNAPMAFFSALFRPFIWESGGNKMKILMGLENLGVLALSVSSLVYLLRRPSFLKELTLPSYLLFLNSLLYILVLLSIIALASPNLGSIARYRVGAYPLFIYLISLPWTRYLEQKSFPRKFLEKLKLRFSKSVFFRLNED